MNGTSTKTGGDLVDDVREALRAEDAGGDVDTTAHALDVLEERILELEPPALTLPAELDALGYGPATLSNDVTEATGINPGALLSARINGAGANLALELSRGGYGDDPGDVAQAIEEAGAYFVPGDLAGVAALVGDSPGLLRADVREGAAPREAIEETLEAVGRTVAERVADRLKAETSTEDLDPEDAEESAVWSRRASLNALGLPASPDRFGRGA